MALSLVWLTAWALRGTPTFETHVDAAQAVERARGTFTLDAPVPLDHASSRDALVKRVTRALLEESLLFERFGVQVSPGELAAEFDRIERQTQDPEQWAAVKHALQDDRRQIEETVCRPLVVERLLRQRFAFDETIHAEAHAKAPEARALFIQGQRPEGSQVLHLARTSGPPPDTRAWLAEAKARARSAVVQSDPPEEPEPPPSERAVSLHPEAARALETQLRRPGDVSTVLSEWDRFAVYRLIETTDDAWTVEAAVFPKRDFASWFRETTAVR